MSAHLANVGPTGVDHSLLIAQLPVHSAPSSLTLLSIGTHKKSLCFLLTLAFCFTPSDWELPRDKGYEHGLPRASSQQKDLSILNTLLAFDIYSLSPNLLLDIELVFQSMYVSATSLYGLRFRSWWLQNCLYWAVHMLTISHIKIFKVIKIKSDVKISSSVGLATFQVLKRQIAIVLDSTDRKHLIISESPTRQPL